MPVYWKNIQLLNIQLYSQTHQISIHRHFLHHHLEIRSKQFRVLNVITGTYIYIYSVCVCVYAVSTETLIQLGSFTIYGIKKKKELASSIHSLSANKLYKVMHTTDAGSTPQYCKGCLPGSPFSADSFSLMVVVQPQGTVTCISISVQVTNPKQWQPYHCLDSQKYSTH